MLDLRWVRGLMQGGEVDLLDLSNGNMLKQGASADVWLELGLPESTAQVDLACSLSLNDRFSGVDAESTDKTPPVAAAGTATGSSSLASSLAFSSVGTVLVAKAACTLLTSYPAALRNLHCVMPVQMRWSALALLLGYPPQTAHKGRCLMQPVRRASFIVLRRL